MNPALLLTVLTGTSDMCRWCIYHGAEYPASEVQRPSHHGSFGGSQYVRCCRSPFISGFNVTCKSHDIKLSRVLPSYVNLL